jgi:hypothetical protein
VGYQYSTPDPDQETPLTPMTEYAYMAIIEKALTSTLPTHYYYNPTYPTATLTLYPIPTSSTLTGVIYAKTAVTSFAALSTSVSLPPGYERMYRKRLALELMPTFGREPSMLLVRQATEAKEVVKRANKRIVDLQFESAALMGKGSGYNIYTDR